MCTFMYRIITQNNLSPKILRQEIATVGDEGYKKSKQGPLSFAKVIHATK